MKKLILLTAFVIAIASSVAQKVYSVDSDYQADVKVFVVDSEYKAGWKENSKKHLMY